MIGLFEPVCAPWKVDGDPGRLLVRRAAARTGTAWRRTWRRRWHRIPVSIDVGVRKFFCGPESFTPDLQPIVGEAPGAAQLLRRGRAQLDRHPDRRRDRPGAGALDRRRPARRRRHRDEHRPAAPRTSATRSTGRPGPSSRSGMVYQCHYPGRSMRTARGAKLSPLHHRLVERRAYFRDVSGWESADWYAPEGVEPDGRRAVLGPAELVPLLGGRAPGGPRGRDPHGHVVHVEVPRAGPRRRPRAGTDLGEPGRRRCRRHHVHPVAQRGRHARGRPDGDQARRRPVLGGRLRHGAPPRRDLDAPPPRRRARVRHRRHRRPTPRSTSRVRARASCSRR